MIGRLIAHYRVQARIGAGSAGEVYRAQDTRLGRSVALKFLAPGRHDDTGKRRFLLEARAASALDHANICTIYDTGETEEGQLYLVMAFYEGDTLAARIRSGTLPVDEFASIGGQIAAGLLRAHQFGIVHRDIKPANLLVTPFGEAKILDFGIATLRGEPAVSEHGVSPGTLAYMSPEQVMGGRADHRTDIWALGVVFYEMLTGRRPFSRDSTEATIEAILYDEPPPLAPLRPDVPAPMADLVERCLRKSPDARVQSCHEIVQVLSNRPPRAGPRREGLPTTRPRWSLLVMPFASDADAGFEHLALGLSDEIMTALSHVPALRVLARSAAERLHQGDRRLIDAARDLGIDYIVAGAVRPDGARLRISANLLDARTGSVVWSEPFGGSLGDIHAIHEEIAGRLAGVLRVRLNVDEREHRRQIRLDDLTSYDYYLRAKREFVRYEPGGLERALAFIESARARAGDNVLLLAAAGQILWQLVNSGSSADRRHLLKARECAQRLLALDPDGAHGPRLMGMVRAAEGHIRESIAWLERAASRDPNDTDTLSLLGPCYGYVGRPQTGMPYVSRLLELDPLTPMYQAMPGYLLLMAGSFDRALAPFAASYGMDPGNPIVTLSYGQCLALNGQTTEAIELFDELQRRLPGGFMANLGQLYKAALLRQPDAAGKWVTPDVEAIADWDMYHAWNLAECFALLGDRQRALHWLGRAIERGMLNYPLLAHLDPFLEAIRQEPRFAALMHDVRRQWEEFSSAQDEDPARTI